MGGHAPPRCDHWPGGVSQRTDVGAALLAAVRRRRSQRQSECHVLRAPGSDGALDLSGKLPDYLSSTSMISNLLNIRRMAVRLPTRLAIGTLVLATMACGTKEAPGPLEPTQHQGRIRFVNLIINPALNPVNAILENVPFGVN